VFVFKRIVCCLGFLLLTDSSYSQDNSTEVSDFITLLVQDEKPTLSEYSKFAGECGGELELSLTLRECKKKGWTVESKECIDYSFQRCQMKDKSPSLALNWLRRRFSTPGKKYEILRVQEVNEGFMHELINVRIGQNIFLLFRNTEPSLPTGTLVDITAINGKKVNEYLIQK
jgi:hypothetical protein